MIIKLIQAKPKKTGIERYARYLASYMADGDRRWLQADAIGMDHGLTLSAYMTRGSNAPEPPRERVLFRAAQVGGQACDWAAGLQAVENRLKRRSRKVKKPVRHGVISCRAGEQLTEQGCSDAVATLARELGCEDAAILWAAHIDTDNFHVHVMFVTVDPVTGGALPFGQGADGRAAYKEAMQRAIARIEDAQQLTPEAGARYEMAGNDVVRKPQGEVIARKRTPLRQEILAWEEATGFASFTRYVQDVAGPILDEAGSWKQLHAALAPHGMGIRSAVNGGEIYAGDEHVKLSNVDRRHSWVQLKKRLDTFEPAVGVTIAPYTPRITDAGRAEAWLGRSRQIRDVSAQIDRRIAALLATRTELLSDTNAQLSAYRGDLAGFDGDARLQRDLSAAWPRLRASATSSITSAFNARIDAVRALRHAAAECDEMDMIDLEAIGAPDIGITSLWSADPAPPPVVVLAGFDAERRGDVVRYWSRDDLARHGPPALVDTGAIIWVNDTSDCAVEAALTLAHERFGSAAVFGDAAYIEQCQRVARRLGLEIETITLAEAKRRTRLRTDEVRRRALEVHVGNRPDATMRQRWARAYRRATPADDLAGWQDQPVMLADLAHHTSLSSPVSEQPARMRIGNPAIRDATSNGRLDRVRPDDRGGID